MLFYGSYLRDWFETIYSEITQKINGFDRNYLLKVSESDLIDSFKEKYSFSPLILKKEEKEIARCEDIDPLISNFSGRLIIANLSQYEKTELLVSIPFGGNSELFFYRGSRYYEPPPQGEIRDNKVFLSIQFQPSSSSEEKIAEEVTKRLETSISLIEKNIEYINNDVVIFNKNLPLFIQDKIRHRKEKLLRDERIVTALNIPLTNSKFGKTFLIPDIKQKILIKLPEVGKEEFVPEPTMSDEYYTTILKIIQIMITAMERSPLTFSKLSEEEIRDFILVYLNGIFEWSATGETFNEYGKTDILINHNGKNVFIAECKFWNGEKSFLSAIDQLLSYASWRDTKIAIIIFNKKKNFSEVLQKIESAIPNHKNYKKRVQKENASNLKYLFHHNDDKNRELYLSVLAFEIPPK
jgi:hypothetical protein